MTWTTSKCGHCDISVLRAYSGPIASAARYNRLQRPPSARLPRAGERLFDS